MEFDELLPPQTDRIYMNKYGTVVMNVNTLIEIANGKEAVIPVSAMQEALKTLSVMNEEVSE